MSKKKPPSPDFEGTRIDLGEDLLQKDTLSAEPSATDATAPAEETIGSLYATARILRGEGLLEEAKKNLHAILLRDSNHSAAKEMLAQIHETELQQIFNSERSRRIFHQRPDAETIDLTTIDREEILRKLDEDLELELGEREKPSFYREPETLAFLGRNLEQDIRDAGPQDRVDLAIGFIEMGLYDLAIRNLETAARIWAENSDPKILSAVSLLALAQILGGKPFEATLSLQPVLSDPEFDAQSKTDLFYLMGRAHEALHELKTARDWYLKTETLDPHYRDIQERLRRLG